MNKRQRRIAPWAVFVAVQVAAVALYFLLTDAVAVTARHALFPVVWVTLSAWVLLKTPLPDELPWYAPVVAVVSGVYFVALLWLAGLVGT
ncbi:MAG: hypothetical protein ACI9QA_000808, partial [Methanobacteriota archaeon]